MLISFFFFFLEREREVEIEKEVSYSLILSTNVHIARAEAGLCGEPRTKYNLLHGCHGPQLAAASQGAHEQEDGCLKFDSDWNQSTLIQNAGVPSGVLVTTKDSSFLTFLF